jgi:hypothetical protein
MVRRASALVGGLLALTGFMGCVGRTEGAGDGGAGNDGGSASGCVDVPIADFDTSCVRDSDCVAVTTGDVCPGACLCGGATINVADQSRYEQMVQGVATGECNCPLEPVPQCVAGTCTVCPAGSRDPGCGVSIADASAPRCVNIPPSTYTTSCSVDSDCTLLPEGQICSGSCDCGGSPVNVAGQAAFATLTAGFQLGGCPCASSPPVRCVAGTCASCEFDPDGGVSCGDGG